MTSAAAATPTGALVTSRGAPMPASPSVISFQEEAERRRRLHDAWNHYTGKLTGPFTIDPGQPDVNVRYNPLAVVVDTGTDFLFGKAPTIQVDQDAADHEKAQEFLDGCWGKPERRATLFAKLSQNGAVFGHCFAKIIPADPAHGRQFCRVVPLDPAQVRVETDPDDVDTVLCYTIEWKATMPDGKPCVKRQRVRRIDPDDPSGADNNNDETSTDADARWEITNWLQRGSGVADSWELVGVPIPWKHQWAPIVDWQNKPRANEHWGAEDIPHDVQHLNSVLNFVLSNINKIGRSHAHPWPWATGIGPTETLTVEPGKLIQFHSPEAKLDALQAHGDIQHLLDFAQDIRLSIAEQTHVPLVALGRFKDLPPATSGIAMRLMYGPLLAQNAHKQNTYGAGMAEVSTRMLALGGFGDGTEQGGVQVNIHWPDPLPSDDLAKGQLAVIKQQLGFSQATLIAELDGDPDEEAEKKADEDAKKATAFAQGQGMPPVPPQAPPAAGGVGSPPPPGAPGADDADPGALARPQPRRLPPINHPAAVAARAAMQRNVGGKQ